MPTATDEKIAFSHRLKLALKRSKKKVETPAELALQFNLRHKHDPITPQSAQKWLNGAARPTVDKIETLSAWLNVPVQWLRYGIPEQKTIRQAKPTTKASQASSPSPTSAELKLIQRIRNLPDSRRELVLELVEQLALEQEIYL